MVYIPLTYVLLFNFTSRTIHFIKKNYYFNNILYNNFITNYELDDLKEAAKRDKENFHQLELERDRLMKSLEAAEERLSELEGGGINSPRSPREGSNDRGDRGGVRSPGEGSNDRVDRGGINSPGEINTSNKWGIGMGMSLSGNSSKGSLSGSSSYNRLDGGEEVIGLKKLLERANAGKMVAENEVSELKTTSLVATQIAQRLQEQVLVQEVELAKWQNKAGKWELDRMGVIIGNGDGVVTKEDC